MTCLIKNVKHILARIAALGLMLTMAGCPLLQQPEPLRPLAFTKTDKYANKTATKPVGSTCRLKKDWDHREYKYDATGRLTQIAGTTKIVDFYYDNEGHLREQQNREISNPYKITLKYHYQNGTLLKVEQYFQENDQGSVKLAKIMFLESGRLRKVLAYTFYASSGNTVENEIPFKLDGAGRITEMGPYSGITSNGVPPVDHYEYDSNGNLTKYYNNTPVYPALDVFRYDNKPNPTYEATRFKGHPESRIVDYLRGSVGVPMDRNDMQPNNEIYSERSYWNYQTNTPYKSSTSRDFIYKSNGYPEKYTFPGNSYQYTYAEYDCN